MKARYTHQQTGVRTDGTTYTVQHDYRHSAPLFNSNRIVNYLRQNRERRELTVRQERAIRKAERRAS